MIPQECHCVCVICGCVYASAPHPTDDTVSFYVCVRAHAIVVTDCKALSFVRWCLRLCAGVHTCARAPWRMHAPTRALCSEGSLIFPDLSTMIWAPLLVDIRNGNLLFVNCCLVEINHLVRVSDWEPHNTCTRTCALAIAGRGTR